MKRVFAGLAALLLLGGVAIGQALVSTQNYQDASGWHVGGLLEVLAGGTFRVDTGTKTATATAGAATLSKLSGKVTSESLTTAAAAEYTLTVTNTRVAAADIAFASVANGTNSAGSPAVVRVTPGAGSLVVVVRNVHASAALNGTIVVSFVVLKN